MGNIFNKDFQDFIVALNNNKVEYLLVGGYSVIAYGYSRTTGDMDIWVNRTKENYEKLVSAFNDFGLSIFEMTENNFLAHPTWDVFRFGRRPVAIDVMIRLKGLDFKAAYDSSVMKELDGINVRIINYNDLISAKKASGRNKDIDDINFLEKK